MNQSSGVGDPLPDLPSLLREADNKAIANLTKKGWVLLHRRFWEDDDFPEESFTELQAWAWLFSEACYEDKHVHFRNRAIPLKRGQLATTIRILAKRFKWGRVKADSFLRKLEKFGKIARQPKDRDYTILTICKYDIYQIPQDNDKTVNTTAGRQPEDSHQPRLKNIKEDKELKDIPAKPDLGKPTNESIKKDPTHGYICKAIVNEIKSKLDADCPYPLAGKIIQRAGWKAGETYPWGLYGHIMVCIGRVSTWVNEQAFIGAITRDLKCRHGKLDDSFAWPETDLTLIKAFENKFEAWVKSEFPQKMDFKIN